MKKNKLTPRIIKRIFILGGIIFTLILSTFCYHNFSFYQKAKRKVNIQKARLLKLEKDMESMRTSLKKYEEEKKKFSQLLFKERDIPGFLRKISSFAKESGVKIVNMKTKHFREVEMIEIKKNVSQVARKKLSSEKEKETITLSYLPINIEVEGKFGSLVNFLIYLEKYRQLLSLADIKISRKKYPILKCKFVLKIYSLKEAKNKKR